MIHFCFSLIPNLAEIREKTENQNERNKTFKIVCEGE